jgi:3-oxoacyl-[acyl-carrier-protein] synthase I
MLIVRCGAVTAVGLSAAQTYAAIRARVSGFERVTLLPPPAEPVSVARVPAARRLKPSPAEWLLNMAALALRDCLDPIPTHSHRIALLLALPDAHREHRAFSGGTGEQLLQALQRHLKLRFHPLSRTLDDGHAAVINGLAVARQLLSLSDVDLCLVGGVDSLLNHQDLARLQAAHRLHDETNPQGVIPGEGAGFVALSRVDAAPAEPVAQILGLGAALEKDTILGERFSTGSGLVEALRLATQDAGCSEPNLSFRTSDMNGERYRAWESLMASTRFYRTRRERMSVSYASASIGDLGAAAGALSVITAAMAIYQGHASGPLGVCEASADNGLRAACILAPAPGAPMPPFRSRLAWSLAAEVTK